ncbi:MULTISPECIES: TonB-dependent receptor [unclassified Spirosoma]|uniref:TonB-dependent receptor n=1 Tax=unclassified Spirosoma TaxID=2621999 RepID=UPI00095E07BC|nr:MULTISPECIES: TonB-dependent receptor [unclassified Spirosoma]MBN8822326.1 TonB-dependent receptor [Spirosoma sp.]OJW72375.1 MAG: TonB-dependent receptor [Spirosoma sp. 48-14]
MKIFIAFFLFVNLRATGWAQSVTYRGVVIDGQTKEPIPGATVRQSGFTAGTSTDAQGRFTLTTQQAVDSLVVSTMGYQERRIVASNNLTIALNPKVEDLQPVVVTASREAQARSEAPVAISRISPTMLQETKAVNLYEVINKTPGVVMPNLGNEQHMMGIRQPFGTNAYYLYLEDGLPVRPMGIFNHNALIELNSLAISSVEVVKGPVSSLYGPEAVGGAVNFLTHRPTAVPVIRVGVMGDGWGYRRAQAGVGGMLTKRLGVFVGTSVARQRNSWQSQSDFDKFSLNLRADYALSDKTRLIGTTTYNQYHSQTGGSVDSVAYYSRTYTSTTDFTYRDVMAFRSRLTLEHQWATHSETAITAFYRDNSLKQNPNYSIRWKTGATTATGEINENSFRSFGLMAQHSQRFTWMDSRLLAGLLYDNSPNTYYAYQTELQAVLRPDGRSVEWYNQVRKLPDQFLSRYEASIYNTAVYAQYDFMPVSHLRLSIGARYDRMSFDYTNFLDKTTGNKAYNQLTPKLGLTYDLGQGRGLYANISRGFSPPGLTAIFRKNTAAATDQPPFYYNLQPALFTNVELGGWASLLNRKLNIDWALYQMNGQNELLSIRQPDNSTDYQSAGRTLHQGLEYSLTYKPNSQWFFRFGGTNPVHRFIDFALSNKQSDAVQNLANYDMPQAPRWVANTELTYKPRWAKGLRLAMEWQRISTWYQNQVNTVRYDDRGAFGARGVSVLNLRTGYAYKGIELYANVLNLTNELYANNATRGNAATDRTTFTPAAPRTFVIGLQYQFTGK